MRIRVCDDNEKERNQLVGICKVKRRYKIVAILFCILILMTGCGKKFWEYPSAWVSNEPYVIINTTNHDAQIEINEKIIQRVDNFNEDPRIFEPYIDLWIFDNYSP